MQARHIAPVLTITLNPAIDLELSVPAWNPKQVMRAIQSRRSAGGKGLNVARVLTTLGIPAVAACVVGDLEGEIFIGLARHEKFQIAPLRIKGPTRTNLTISATGKPLCKINQPGPKMGASEWRQIKSELAALMPGRSWVVITGAPPPGLKASAYAELTRLAHTANARVALDCGGPVLRHALQACPDLIKPNRSELAETVGRSLTNRSSILKAIRELQARGARQLIVTNGPRAVYGLSETPKDIFMLHPPRVKASGVVGAGDAFLAGLIAGLTKKDVLRKCLNLALACGVATSTLPDPLFPKKLEIERWLGMINGSNQSECGRDNKTFHFHG